MQHSMTLSGMETTTPPRKGFFTRLGELLDRWLATVRAWVGRWRPVPASSGIDIDAEVAETKRQMRELLEWYEAQYGMSSEEFYTRWLAEEIEDTMETTEWAMLCSNREWAHS